MSKMKNLDITIREAVADHPEWSNDTIAEYVAKKLELTCVSYITSCVKDYRQSLTEDDLHS